MSSGTSRPGLTDRRAEAARTEAAPTELPSPAVLILADDLIWSTRLADAVAAAGGRPQRIRQLAGLEGFRASHAIVDLTARAYDGVAAIKAIAATGARVVAVGQHDDVPLRRAAQEAGAERVFTYRALFEAGPRTIAKWLTS
jgi:ActR/RegA family two-component response regulator